MPIAAATASITNTLAAVTFPISRPFVEVAADSTGKIRSCQRRQDMPCGVSGSVVGFRPRRLYGPPRLVGTSSHGLPEATLETWSYLMLSASLDKEIVLSTPKVLVSMTSTVPLPPFETKSERVSGMYATP